MSFSLTGCTLVFQKGRRVDTDKISKLKNELNSLEGEVSTLEVELSALEKAKRDLENRMRKEIADNEVKVEMLEKGLTITFVSEVLFDSGKAELRKDASSKISKVAKVLNTTVKDLDVGVEGHTDNVPIKYSGWKSNWELSTARALSVLHNLVDKHKVKPVRLSAIGQGEFKPVTSNKTKEGRQKNRRVEIVILPEAFIDGR